MAKQDSTTAEAGALERALNDLKKLPASEQSVGAVVLMLAEIGVQLRRIADTMEGVVNKEDGFVRPRAVKFDYE